MRWSVRRRRGGRVLRHALWMGIDSRLAQDSRSRGLAASDLEWMPADFSSLGAFELSILALIAGGLYCGVRLSPPRIALVLGLFHLALSHVRNIEIFALLLPMVMLTPLSLQFAPAARPPGRTSPVASTVMLVAMLGFQHGHSRPTTHIRLPRYSHQRPPWMC